MESKTEYVETHCIRMDCRYRGWFDHKPACMYMLYTGKPRGCSISECTRYKTGKMKPTSNMDGLYYNDI